MADNDTTEGTFNDAPGETAEAALVVETEVRPARLWRNRDYLLLWGGQAVSSLGGATSELALPLMILGLTGSPAQAGFAAALRSLAYLLMGLPAGAFIDRWDRKRTMIFCDAGRAVAMGSIPLALSLGRLSMAQIYTVALVEGTLFVFFSLAQTAALPRVVGKSQLSAATSQEEVTNGLVTLLGPSLGGALYGLARSLPFLADAVTYTASVISLACIRLPFQEERAPRFGRLRQEIGEGLVWLWREPVLRSLAVLHSGLVLCVAGMTLLLVVIAEGQHATPLAIGLMLGIGGAGAVVGASLGGRIALRFRLGSILVGVYWLFVVLWPLYAVAPSPLALGAILAAFWVGDEVYDVAQVSYRLTLIPDALRGRVTSTFRLLTFSADALGIALTGVLLQQLGTRWTIAVIGAGLLMLALAATLDRGIRGARPLAEL